MKRIIGDFLIYYFILVSAFHQVLTLKCRTGNQQSDDQFQKIMQVCRRRFNGYDRDSGRDFNSRDTDSQESSDSDSDEDVFDNKFLTSSGGNRYNKNGNNNGVRYDYAGSSPSSRNMTRYNNNNNWGNGRSSYSNNNMNGGGGSSNYDNNGQMNSNRRNMRNSGMGSSASASRNYGYNSENGYSNSNSRYNNNYGNNNNNMNRNNNNNNNNDDNDGEREQACVVQCFFNELNLVDQRGFPERSSVTSIMIQNIQDPELRDFIEESVLECFHYLSNMNNNRQDKCQFSQNLLSCLAEKGSERCEDWDDDKR